MRYKLWIDDVRRPPDDTWHWETTIDGAKTYYMRHRDDLTHISFDHDLGWDTKRHDYTSTIELANEIERMSYEGKNKKFEWTIHSMNPVGRQHLYVILQKCDDNWQMNDGVK